MFIKYSLFILTSFIIGNFSIYAADRCESLFSESFSVELSESEVKAVVPFIEFQGVEPDFTKPMSEQDPKIWMNYLQMNVNFEPIRELKNSISTNLGKSLDGFNPKTGKSDPRTEAHITVITPPEYNESLAGSITMNEINQIAKEMLIQYSEFEIIGIGSGSSILNKDGNIDPNGNLEETFFIVVKSEDLTKIRQAIFDFAMKNPNRNDQRLSKFEPNKFYSHITVGYTFKDLHIFPHNVIKDETSLDSRIQLISIR